VTLGFFEKQCLVQ